MILQVPKLSRQKLKAIFDEEQWVVMAALLKQLEQGMNAIGFGADCGRAASGLGRLKD